MAKRVGFGATLGVRVTSTGSYSVLGIIEGVTGPEASRTDIDTTLLADQYMTSAPGQIDPGNCTFSIAYDPDDATTTQTLVGLLTQTTPLPSWQITYPVSASTTETAPTETFSGYVNGIGREIAKDAMITSEISIKVSGNPGFTSS